MGSTQPADGQDVIVLASGDAVVAASVPPLPEHSTVIAADGGLACATVLDLQVDIVVGDMDSVDDDDLATARAAGARVDEYPVDKDRTDLAIALDTAMEIGGSRIIVVGGHGGRLDHHLANLLLLASPAYRDIHIVAYMGGATVTVVRHVGHIDGRPGETVSLLPLHGPARNVTTEGLRFPLHGEDLSPGSSRGVSNELTSARAAVRLDTGVLVAIQPGDHAHTD